MDFEWEDDFLVPVIELETGELLDLEDVIEIEEDKDEMLGDSLR